MSESAARRGILAATAVLALGVTGCSSDTVEGTYEPSTQSSSTGSSAASPPPSVEVSEPTPGPPPPMTGEPVPPGEPAPEAMPPEAAPPGAPQPPPGPPPEAVGMFLEILGRNDVVLPEGQDPVALAGQSCVRFDQGQTMVDITGWLGETTGLTPERQGLFLGTAVASFCPHNASHLG